MIERGQNGWRCTCDRCEFSVDMPGEYGSIVTPDGWTSDEVSIHEEGFLDLCPSCVKSFKEWLNESPSQ